MLDKTVFADHPLSRAQRLRGLATVGVDADPIPDRCRAHLDRGANDDGLITPKDRLMFLLKLTVNRQGRDLRPITNKLNSPVGRWLRSDNGGGGVRVVKSVRWSRL